MSALRPLPPRPSLEFERKEAKALLRRFRAGDPDAIARARLRHPILEASSNERITLADAQLVVAREYGFASWPRLVRYFEDLERQQHGPHQWRSEGLPYFERMARNLAAEHHRRQRWAALALLSYVPRLYGLSEEDAFATTITEHEARLVVARMHNFPSWEVLLERTTAALRYSPNDLEDSPFQLAGQAMGREDLECLVRVVEEYPELLESPDEYLDNVPSLLSLALHHERRKGRPAMRPIVDWLASRGCDVQLELNRQLCGHMHISTEKVRWLLERGANPGWIAPNGIPVLEHALIRYWNSEAVDLVAAQSKHRTALWIAAGLGDVATVRRLLDAKGRPTAEARAIRPDFNAVGQRGFWPMLPEASDEDVLLAAFVVAMLNRRTQVLEYMISRGFPVNSDRWGMPPLAVAVGNGMADVVESLVRSGADVDVRGTNRTQSVRDLARERFEYDPENANGRRIVQLLGMDPDTLIAERDARPLPTPELHPIVKQAIELAGDDARRRGLSDIDPESLLFGLLRNGSGGALSAFVRVSGMDVARFRADLGQRMRSPEDRAGGPALSRRVETQQILDRAIQLAAQQRSDVLTPFHVLAALMEVDGGAAAALLERYGGSVSRLREHLARLR